MFNVFICFAERYKKTEKYIFIYHVPCENRATDSVGHITKASQEVTYHYLNGFS